MNTWVLFTKPHKDQSSKTSFGLYTKESSALFHPQNNPIH